MWRQDHTLQRPELCFGVLAFICFVEFPLLDVTEREEAGEKFAGGHAGQGE